LVESRLPVAASTSSAACDPSGQRQGANERIMLRELLRRVDLMVLLENRLDVLARLHTPFALGKIGGASAVGF
jgi:hypothetical protein